MHPQQILNTSEHIQADDRSAADYHAPSATHRVAPLATARLPVNPEISPPPRNTRTGEQLARLVFKVAFNLSSHDTQTVRRSDALLRGIEQKLPRDSDTAVTIRAAFEIGRAERVRAEERADDVLAAGKNRRALLDLLTGLSRQEILSLMKVLRDSHQVAPQAIIARTRPGRITRLVFGSRNFELAHVESEAVAALLSRRRPDAFAALIHLSLAELRGAPLMERLEQLCGSFTAAERREGIRRFFDERLDELTRHFPVSRRRLPSPDETKLPAGDMCLPRLEGLLVERGLSTRNAAALCHLLEREWSALADAAKVKLLVHKPGRYEDLARLLLSRSDNQLREIAETFRVELAPHGLNGPRALASYIDRFMQRSRPFAFSPDPLTPEYLFKSCVTALLRGERAKALAYFARVGKLCRNGDMLLEPFENRFLRYLETFDTFEERRRAVRRASSEVARRPGRDPSSVPHEAGWREIAPAVRGADEAIVRSVIEDGRAPAWALIRHYLLLPRPNVARIVDLLNERGAHEVREIVREYVSHCGVAPRDTSDYFLAAVRQLNRAHRARKNHTTGERIQDPLRALEHDFERRVSGSRLYDLREALRGSPTLSDEIADRVRRRFEHERKGVASYFYQFSAWCASALSALGDGFDRLPNGIGSPAARSLRFLAGSRGEPAAGTLRRLDRDMQRLERLCADPTLSLQTKQAQYERFCHDCRHYRERKVFMAEQLANWGSGAVILGMAASFHGGGLPFWAIPSAACAVGFASRSFLEVLGAGPAADHEEVWRNAGRAFVDGAFLKIGTAGRYIGKTAMVQRAARSLPKLAKAAAKTGLKRLIDWLEPASVSLSTGHAGRAETLDDSTRNALRRTLGLLPTVPGEKAPRAEDGQNRTKDTEFARDVVMAGLGR